MHNLAVNTFSWKIKALLKRTGHQFSDFNAVFTYRKPSCNSRRLFAWSAPSSHDILSSSEYDHSCLKATKCLQGIKIWLHVKIPWRAMPQWHSKETSTLPSLNGGSRRRLVFDFALWIEFCEFYAFGINLRAHYSLLLKLMLYLLHRIFTICISDEAHFCRSWRLCLTVRRWLGCCNDWVVSSTMVTYWFLWIKLFMWRKSRRR